MPSGTLWIKIPIATVMPNSGDSLADAAFKKRKKKGCLWKFVEMDE
jgi:hypothetical protein